MARTQENGNGHERGGGSSNKRSVAGSSPGNKPKQKHKKKKSRGDDSNRGSAVTKTDIDKANKYIAENTNNVTIMIHPTMLVYFTYLKRKGGGGQMMYIADVNHNVPNGNKIMKLVNGMLDNPLQLAEGIDKDWGLDTQLFVHPHDKVSFPHSPVVRNPNNASKYFTYCKNICIPGCYIYQNVKLLYFYISWKYLTSSEKTQLLFTTSQDDDLSTEKPDSVLTLKTVTVTHSNEPDVRSRLVPVDSSPTWFEDQLADEGLKDLLLRDLRKSEDRLFVATANGLGDAWHAIEKVYTDRGTTNGLLYDFYSFLSENRTRDKLVFAPCEGMHRTSAATHVMLNSSVDLFTGTMKKNSLNISDFKKENLTYSDRITQDNINDAMALAMTFDESRKGILDVHFVAKVYYAKSAAVSSNKVVEALRVKSQAYALAKITSAYPRPLSNVGKWFAYVMGKLEISDFGMKPDLTKFDPVKVQQRITIDKATEAMKECMDNGTASPAQWQSHPLLKSKAMQAYIEDPTSAQNEDAVRDAFSCRAEGTDYTKKMKPPFYQSYQSMATEPGTASLDTWDLTTEMLTAWLIAPRIILELYAGRLNKQPQEVVNDPTRKALTNYILNFHLSGEIGYASVNYVHGALTAQYQGYPMYQSKGSVNYGDGLIGAVILCVNMFNAVLCSITRPDANDDMEKLMLAKLGAINFIEDALKTCEPSGGDPDAVDSIWHLGELHFLNIQNFYIA